MVSPAKTGKFDIYFRPRHKCPPGMDAAIVGIVRDIIVYACLQKVAAACWVIADANPA
jgi:hypothetical protein